MNSIFELMQSADVYAVLIVISFRGGFMEWFLEAFRIVYIVWCGRRWFVDSVIDETDGSIIFDEKDPIISWLCEKVFTMELQRLSEGRDYDWSVWGDIDLGDKNQVFFNALTEYVFSKDAVPANEEEIRYFKQVRYAVESYIERRSHENAH